MPTTRTQKKARESRGVEMLSDIENLDMLGGNHLEKGESEFSDSIGRSDSPKYNALEGNEDDSYSNPSIPG